MTTSITNTLLNQRNEILQEWLRQQLSAQNLRADLISEAELRTDSNQFLNVLSDAAGFSAHLTKPCDLSVLNVTIEKILS